MDGMIDCPSPNFDDRDQAVSVVVLHYTGMEDAASAISRLRDPEARVSCHYLIAEDGQVLRMVRRGKARLARRPVLLAGPAEPERGQHRHRNRQSGPRIRLSAIHFAADGCARAAARRYRRASPGAPRKCRRPFRHRPRAQAGSRRIVRLGPAGAPPPRGGASDKGSGRSVVDRRRLPARARALWL